MTSRRYPQIKAEANSRTGDNPTVGWQSVISSSIEALRRIAGTTEDEFLQIGSDLQGFYLRSTDISGMANRLLEVVSGENIRMLTGRLQQMLGDIESYLTNARNQSGSGCMTLESLRQQLDELSEPLEGFHKMNKALSMLSISTKIESARLGEMGNGFVYLALDVEKLSRQVSEKSTAILEHRQMLATIIAANLNKIHSSEAFQNIKVTSALGNTSASLQELLSVNERCTAFGATVSAISGGVTASIGEVVSSMQFHDITRQQVEHVFEALERLSADMAGFNEGANGVADEGRRRALIIEAGDVCELQEAQLRFASGELYTAVRTIVDNLRDIACEQSHMAHETRNVAVGNDSTDTSFVDEMKDGMTTVTDVLLACERADRDMTDIMRKVARTIGEISNFVTDIEYIGSEIDLIAINAQIKAAHTGPEGAALGVLAQAIKRLSDESVRHTGSVASILNGITSATSVIASNESDGTESVNRIATMQDELGEILQTLGIMNSDLNSVLSGLNERVGTLTADVERVTATINVHEQVKQMAEEILAGLDRIVGEARQIEPASTEFKQNLQHMEKRYTMDSERHIHEAIARKRGVQLAAVINSQTVLRSSNDSCFGDNVDLF